MGHALSYIAVRGRDHAGVVAVIGEHPGLRVTEQRGWTVFLSDVRDCPWEPEGVLDRLSIGCEVVRCAFVESSTYSEATKHLDGQRVWLVRHDGSESRESLEIEGEPPSELDAVRASLLEKQRMGQPDIDYLFEAPMRLVKALTGFTHTNEGLLQLVDRLLRRH